MTRKENDSSMSNTPHDRIANIIFEKKNSARARFKIMMKIIGYLVLASFFGASLSNISIKYKYGELIQEIEDIKKSGDIVILDYTKIIKEVSPSLVTISDSKEKLIENNYSKNTITGVIIDPNGIILTNYSTLKDKSDIFVKLSSIATEPIQAKVLVENEELDLAIIKINFEGELKAINIADPSTIREGQQIVVLGNAIGDDYIGSAIPGIITSTSEKLKISGDKEHSLLQVNAPINERNTGGAICNGKGELVAISNLTITKERNEEGLYYGLQTAELQEMIKSTDSFKKILGINEGGVIIDKNSDFRGFYIDELDKNGNAYKAGIKPTDIIVGIDGYEVINIDDIITILQNKNKGDILSCSILSDGKLKEIDIRIE